MLPVGVYFLLFLDTLKFFVKSGYNVDSTKILAKVPTLFVKKGRSKFSKCVRHPLDVEKITGLVSDSLGFEALSSY